jgi:membrane protein YqaA with SNARE-associated domain
VATLGNVLGCVLTFGMGVGARRGMQRFAKVKVDLNSANAQRLARWGPPALFLSFLPLVGDALVLAAGWLRMPFWSSLFWIALGKATRYLVLALSLLGLLKLA